MNSKSKQEELLGVLWLIAGLIALSAGFTILGWILIVKAAFDTLASIVFAVTEARTGDSS